MVCRFTGNFSGEMSLRRRFEITRRDERMLDTTYGD
jgi:hypothetical protein